MIKGRLFYNIMTSEEQSRWDECVGEVGGFNHRDHLFNRGFMSFSDFICESFIWSDTRYGHTYWSVICGEHYDDKIIIDKLKPYTLCNDKPKIWP